MDVSRGLIADVVGEVDGFWSAIGGESCVSRGREDSLVLKGSSS
jgi:hypothetical protein